MLPGLRAALILLCLTVVIHAGGLTALLRRCLRSPALHNPRFWPQTWLLIRIVAALLAIHLVEIAVWALFYWWQGCLPDGESAFYFSGVTYATLGYGDLVLPKDWRLLGPAEGLIGILMCGLSTGFLFALVSRMYAFPTGGTAEPK